MAAIEALVLIRHLSKAFPNVAVSDATVEIYAERLGRIPVAELGHVVSRAIETCKFFPSLAELLELHRGLRATPIQASDIDADEKHRQRKAFLGTPPPELQALIDGVAKRMTPDPRLLS